MTPSTIHPAAHAPVTAHGGPLVKMLDAVDYGIVLVDAQRGVIFANLAARIDMSDECVLEIDNRRLRARRPADADALDAAVRDAATRGLQRLLTLGEPGSGLLAVAVTPGEAGSAMVALARRAPCNTLSVEAAARQLGLTDAEVRVLTHLCAGRRPIAIARSQGVEISTVRTQIGSIRAKIGARDIGGVLRHMAALPPLRSVFARS